ncbi:hypothetical protein D9M69_574650 [compost metagenome]
MVDEALGGDFQPSTEHRLHWGYSLLRQPRRREPCSLFGHAQHMDSDFSKCRRGLLSIPLDKFYGSPAGLALLIRTPNGKANHVDHLARGERLRQCRRHEYIVRGAADKREVLALLAIKCSSQRFTQPRQ